MRPKDFDLKLANLTRKNATAVLSCSFDPNNVFFGAPLGWSFHRCSRAPYFLLHHSFSPLNANPSLFSTSCFSLLSPFVHFETSHRRWWESQPVLPSPWLILVNSVCFAFLLFAQVSRKKRYPFAAALGFHSHIFFFPFQGASHAFLINGLSVYGSKHVWILIFERISKEMFFRFCRKIHQKILAHCGGFTFCTYLYLYIYM